MNDSNFLRLSRRFFENPLWEEHRVFSRAEAWLDCIRTAAWESHRRMIAGNMIEIPRGGFVASVRYLSDRWTWSKTKVCGFLDLLEKEGMITREKGQVNTIIFLCKFENYNPKNGHVKDTEKTLAGHSPDEREEDKEDKEENPPAREASLRKLVILPTLTQCMEFAPMAGVNPDAAECWWLDCEGRGISPDGYFIDAKGAEIRHWQSAMTSYGRKWQANDARSKSNRRPGKTPERLPNHIPGDDRL